MRQDIIFKNKKLVLIDASIVGICLVLLIYIRINYDFIILISLLIVIIIFFIVKGVVKLLQPEILVSIDKDYILINGKTEIKIPRKSIIKIERRSFGLGLLLNYGKIEIHTRNDSFVLDFVSNVKTVREDLTKFINN